MRKQKAGKKSGPKTQDRKSTGKARFDPRYEDVTDAIHSPRPAEAKTPSWLRHEKELAKADRIADWNDRKLNYTVAQICQMLGVKPAFVVEVYEYFGLEPFPARGDMAEPAASRHNAHTVWTNGGPRDVGVTPKSKGGPAF